MFAIKTMFQGRSFFFYKGQDFLPGVDKARLFRDRSRAVGVAETRFPGSKVVPVETRPALYRVRMGTALYLAGEGMGGSNYFQSGKAGSLTFAREEALILARDLGATVVPAV